MRLKTRKKIERRKKKKTKIFTLLRVCGDVIAQEARVIPFHKKDISKILPRPFFYLSVQPCPKFLVPHTVVSSPFLFLSSSFLSNLGLYREGGRDAIKSLLLLSSPALVWGKKEKCW